MGCRVYRPPSTKALPFLTNSCPLLERILVGTELSGLAMPPADPIGGVKRELPCTVLPSPFRLGLNGAARLKADCDVEPDSL